MIIKGIRGGKRNRGEIIELSPEEKVTEALQAGLSRGDAGGFDGFLVSVLKPSVALSGDVAFNPKGYALKKTWQNNSYTARGKCKLRRHNIEKNYIMEPKDYSFEIKFEDSLDDLGQPDLKITEIKFAA